MLRKLQGAIVLGMALGLTCCGPSPAEIAKAKAQKEQLARQAADHVSMQAATAVVSNTLKDPDSVHFRNVRVVNTRGDKGSSAKAICGEINAKNSYGGYVGYQPFWYVVDFHPVKTDDTVRQIHAGLFQIVAPIPTAGDPSDFKDKFEVMGDMDDLCAHDGQSIRDSDLRWVGNLAMLDEYLKRYAGWLGVDLSRPRRH